MCAELAQLSAALFFPTNFSYDLHSSSKETQLFWIHFSWWPWVRVSGTRDQVLFCRCSGEATTSKYQPVCKLPWALPKWKGHEWRSLVFAYPLTFNSGAPIGCAHSILVCTTNRDSAITGRRVGKYQASSLMPFTTWPLIYNLLQKKCNFLKVGFFWGRVYI